MAWPFYSKEYTTDTLTQGVHPFFLQHRDFTTGAYDVDMLWPIYSYRYRPERKGVEDYERSYLFPLYYSRVETRFGRENIDRYLLPIYFSGREERAGKYFILFPIIWYAANARLAVPLFPARPVTFGAIFPLAGDIRGYFNRDRIAFFLWPLFVYSAEGTGEDFNELYSFLWPITGLYQGERVKGFRLWPLFSWVKKEGEFTRSYWLWPLGHYRTGRVSKTDDTQQQVTLFLPFYADFKRPNLSLEMLFPFYGRLDVGARTTKGYALALYNQDINRRKGIREDRYFWFLIRHKSPIPGVEIDDSTTVGGGFFPFYTRTHSRKRVSKNILWPFHLYRYNIYNEYTFKRSYIIPVYSRQDRVFNDGRHAYSTYIFPFYRRTRTLNGTEESNYLHLFPYTRAAPMDRGWAPLWTFWEKKIDTETGATTIRVAKELSKYELAADGTVRRQGNYFFFRYLSEQKPGEARTGYTKVLFGLVEKSRDPEPQLKILGIRF